MFHIYLLFVPSVANRACYQLRLRIGSGALCTPAMASSETTSRSFWSDSEIVVDKDGIPHFTGEQPALMKEYRRRVLFAFNSLEGDGDTEAKEKADLVKKRKRFASRLVNGLHGEAWKAVENLLADTEALRKEDGYKAVLACLQKIEKEGVIRKTEAFDNFFEGAGRKAAESMDHYLRRKQQAWDDLKDLDDQTSMSDDLLTYFLLKGSGLSREDRRGILLANKNTYDKKGVEQALRVSYHDLHDREKRSWKSDQSRRSFQSSRPAFRKSYATVDEEVASSFEVDDGSYHLYYDDSEHYANEYDVESAQAESIEEAFVGADEESEEGFSEDGALQDPEVQQAYAIMNKQRQGYKEARKKLREVQKSRGFFRPGQSEERKKAIEREKATSRCSACGKLGHWAGDAICQKSSASGPKPGSSKGSKGKSRGKSKSRAAYLVSPEPVFFQLGFDDEDGEAFCNMAGSEDEMEQDAGLTELDLRRKKVASYSQGSESEWDKVSMGYSQEAVPYVPESSYTMPVNEEHDPTKMSRFVQETQGVIRPPLHAKIEVREVSSFSEVQPKNLKAMRGYELQAECDRWGVQTGGSKSELLHRLQDLFSGAEVPKKRCSVQFLKLVEENPEFDRGLVPCRHVGRRRYRLWRRRIDSGHRQGRWWRSVLRIWCQVSLLVVCSVRSAVPSWFLEGIVQMAIGSSHARRRSREAVISLVHCMMAWTLSTASWMVASASPVEATPPSSDQMVEAPVAFCHMTGEETHENENLNMILEKNSEAEQSAFEHENVVSLALKAHHQLRSNGGGLNESLVALIDTACTSCMHSKAWREAYSRSLPEGFHCEATDKTKVFHFADGSSTGSNVAVWNIPIFLLNRPGAVLSAEIPTGTTPLLLSISSLVALDAVIFMRRRVMQLKELDLEIPLLTTRTKHLAISVAYDPGQPSQEQQPNPLLVSSAEDLFVYFNEEAEAEVLMLEKGLEEVDQAVSEEVACKANFRLRGISAEDKRGELHERRAKELANTMRRLTKEDERCWAALRKQYTLAEQTATYSFSSTVVFEPFGGSFMVTRVARQQYGWTCSQPLDLLDGYDLLTKPGRRLLFQTLKWHRPYLVVVAFDCRIWSLLTNMSPSLDWNQLRDSVGRETLNLVQAICQYQCQHGRYYLVENPGTSAAWQYHGILTKLLNQWDGKFILGDQCAYGLVDQESKGPIMKSTGWLSNSECVLNKLGKKCRCAPNSHQQVIGRNQGGLRSRQAAAYPLGICQAICQGILQSMKLEYVAMHQQKHFAFPVEDENEIVETPPFTEENILLHNTANEAEPDVWQVDQGRHQLIRYHGIPRQQLFVPNADTDCPIPLDWLTSWRLTKVKYLDGEMVDIEIGWRKRVLSCFVIGQGLQSLIG